VTRFAVLPAVHQVPGDGDNSMRFSGTMTMLDPQALAAGDLAKALVRDLPITADRRVQAVKTSGSTVVLNDHTVISGPDGNTLTSNEKQYAVDRRSLMERPAPKNVAVENHHGISAGFPLEPKKRDYPFWDGARATTSPAKYSGTEKREGRETYVYTVQSRGPLVDPTSLASLPQSMPRTAVEGLSAVAFPERASAVTAALGTGSEAVPVTYISVTDLTGWIDTQTGVTVDMKSTQSVIATFAPSATAPGVELFPMM